MRADFDAAAITPPLSPICAPTATALERSLTARPLQSPANDGSRPIASAIVRNESIAVTLKRNVMPIATPCSSRCAPHAGAIAFTADAPQIIVPPATRSTSGLRTRSATPRRWETKNALGTDAAATMKIVAISVLPKNDVCTFIPIRMIERRSTHLPVKRRPDAYRSGSRSLPTGPTPTSRPSGVLRTSAPRKSAMRTSERSGDGGRTFTVATATAPIARASAMPGTSARLGSHWGRFIARFLTRLSRPTSLARGDRALRAAVS